MPDISDHGYSAPPDIYSMDISGSDIYSTALRLVECGLSVIPIRADGSKGPALAGWKEFQRRRPLPAEISEWFAPHLPMCGVAVIGGVVSHNLTILDFDEPGLVEHYGRAAREQGFAGLLDTIPVAITPSGGAQMFFRSDSPPPGNQKLAYTTDRKIRIETRGEGGYALIPPSPGECHPTGKPYRYQHLDLGLVPTITSEERAELLAIARLFNEWTEPEHVVRDRRPSISSDGLRPGDDYNNRGQWQPLLTELGMTLRRRRGETEDWGWSDAPRKISATVNHGGSNLLYMFSSNAYPFEADKAYSLFAAYALLRHGGDYASAAKALAAQGYGEKRSRPVFESPAPMQTFGPMLPSEDGQATLISSSSEMPNFSDGEGIRFTDLGNARRLIAAYGRDLRYVHAWKRWMHWDSRRWADDETGHIQRRLREVIAAQHAEADAEPDEERAKRIRDWARKCEAHSRLTAAVAVAADEPGIPLTVEEMDQHPMLLNVLNGTIDLQTGCLRPHDRSHYLTKLASVVYDEDATCPRWLAFLSRILDNNTDTIRFLQRAVGFALTGDTRRRHLIILYGKGRNGKSTFLDTLYALLGDYALTTSSDVLMVKQPGQTATHDLARLRGARLVTASETEDGAKIAAGLVKQVTGNDIITARLLYENAFEFKPEFKLFLATNHQPRVSATDDGLWDRLRFVPFTVRIPDDEVDEALPVRLLDELPGILTWALQGCLAWQKEGLGYPASVENATNAYRQEMDTIGQFLSECCVPLKGKTPAMDIYNAYARWCEDRGEYKQKHTAFGRALTDRDYPAERIGGKVYRVGLGLAYTEGEQDG